MRHLDKLLIVCSNMHYLDKFLVAYSNMCYLDKVLVTYNNMCYLDKVLVTYSNMCYLDKLMFTSSFSLHKISDLWGPVKARKTLKRIVQQPFLSMFCLKFFKSKLASYLNRLIVLASRE